MQQVSHISLFWENFLNLLHRHYPQEVLSDSFAWSLNSSEVYILALLSPTWENYCGVNEFPNTLTNSREDTDSDKNCHAFMG